jgi:penicillin-binding protein 1A
LATLINDAPIVIDDPSQPNLWRPHNENLKFNGPMRMKEALVHSRNMVSIRILDDITIDYAIDFAARFGFQKKNMPHGLSLALGTLSVSPLDHAAAYAVFANGGYKIEPYLIDHITDINGKVILQAKPISVCNPCTENFIDPDVIAPRVIPEDIAFLMNSALMGVVQRGTASGAKVLNRHDIAGKTGTTNDQVDAWFAGYNPDLVVTTWVGYDTPRPLHEYAAQLALPVWIDFMKVALHGQPEKEMKQPKNVVSIRINPDNGLLAKPDDIKAVLEYFRDDEIPVTNENEQNLPPENTPTLQDGTTQPQELDENLF